MSDAPAIVADAWTAYRVTHGAQTEALVAFVRGPDDDTEARYRDAAAAFRTAVYARDTALLSYIEHIVARAQDAGEAAQDAATAVTEAIGHVNGGLKQLTIAIERLESERAADAEGLRALIAERLPLREPGA